MPRLSAEAALAHLAARSPSSILMGLDRVREALTRLGNPERRVPALHVAGTNGKGSVSAMAAACLGARYRVGLYTSPHLERVNERFRLDGADVSDAALGDCLSRVLEVLGNGHPLTYFELATVAAFQLFADAAVDVAVLEVGLGGRLDATTACDARVCCITPVAIDHREYLGDTLAAIAGEKAGIVKRGVPLVVARQAPEALGVIEAAAARDDAPLRLEGRDFSGRAGATGLDYRGARWALEALPTPLAGAHQVGNEATALACLEALGEGGFALTPAEVREGLSATRWPGRLEWVDGALLDGAHNVAGVETLVAALPALAAGRPVHLVFGVLADKAWEPMLHLLMPRCASVALTPLPSPRSLRPEAYVDVVRQLVPSVSVHGSVAEALAAARSRPGVTVVAGSLVLVGEARALLRAR